MCYDYDDIEYKGIKNVRKLFGKFNEDYRKPVKIVSGFNGNYTEYESKEDKDKDLLSEEYLDIIRPYLSEMINTHKTPINLRVHSGDGLINYETQLGEWEIQLTMSIKFILFRDSNETRIMQTKNDTKNDNIEIKIGSETDDIVDEFFKSLFAKISREKRRINERK